MEVDSDVVQAFSLRNSQLSGRSRLLNIISIPNDECYVLTWKLGISGVGIPPPEERVFQAQEVIFANTEPQETCSFNIRLVSGV